MMNDDCENKSFELTTDLKEWILNLLSKLYECDLVMTNGNEKLVGVFYDEELSRAPIQKLLTVSSLIFFLVKIAKANDIYCIEEKLLTAAFDERYWVDSKYYHPLANLYAKIFKSKDDYLTKLHQRKKKIYVIGQIYELKSSWYKKAMNLFMKSIHDSEKQRPDSIDIYIKEKIEDLKETYDILPQECYDSDSDSETYLIYHESEIESIDVEYAQIIGIQILEQEICVFSYGVRQVFDLNDVQFAFGLVEVLLKADQRKLQRYIDKYFLEFDINQRNAEIAFNSIKVLVADTLNQKEIEFVCEDYEKILAKVYIKKSTSKMYEVSITYNEFLRNPNEFKSLITQPHKKTSWNFSCNERTLDQAVFEK